VVCGCMGAWVYGCMDEWAGVVLSSTPHRCRPPVNTPNRWVQCNHWRTSAWTHRTSTNPTGPQVCPPPNTHSRKWIMHIHTHTPQHTHKHQHKRHHHGCVRAAKDDAVDVLYLPNVLARMVKIVRHSIQPGRGRFTKTVLLQRP